MTASLHVAAMSVDVSPRQPVILSGNGHPREKITAVDDPVTWQAVRLNDGHTDIYIISGDFLSAGKEMRRVAEKALTGVAPENILLTATHTHGGPAIDPLLPVLGPVDQDYLTEAGTKLSEMLKGLSTAKLQTAALRHAKGSFAGNVYRRRKTWRPRPPFRAMAMMPDEQVAIPEDLHLIRLESEDGNPIALLWSWACHPTCYPEKKAISADFPGYVRARLGEKYPGVPVLFLQGFAGDIRPALYERGQSVKAKLKRLIYGKAFGAVDPTSWNNWAEALFDAVEKTDQTASASPPLQSVNFVAHRYQVPLSDLQDQPAEGRDLIVQNMTLAKGLKIAALGCEPVSGLARYFPADHDEAVITVGYVDHIFGYLPTNKQMTEHGYEDSGFRSNFSLPGKYYDDVEERLVAAISDPAV